MLKPGRKNLREEIKKDPIIETFEKIQQGFYNNKKNLINILLFLVLIIFGFSVFLSNKKKTELEADTAFSVAMVAYSNLDYGNAKFQFESISSNYEGTESEILANYYLGKIAYVNNDFHNAELFLNEFLDNTKNSHLVCGAVKQLVDISFQRNDYLKGLEIIDRVKIFNLNNISKLDIKLLKISAFLKINDLKNANKMIDKVLTSKSIPTYVKQKVDEYSGLL